MDQQKYPPASFAWLVWGLAAAFHFNGFFHRIAPAIITDQLMAEFQIGATGLGNLTAFFFYSYASGLGRPMLEQQPQMKVVICLRTNMR